MDVQTQIETYLESLPEPKRGEMKGLHGSILSTFPNAELSFLDGKDETGKVVTNPNIGYGRQNLRYADGSTRDFYQVGMSGNTGGISVFIMGLNDKTYLPQTYGNRLGKATVTSYCIKFKKLSDIDREELMKAIEDGIRKTVRRS